MDLRDDFTRLIVLTFAFYLFTSAFTASGADWRPEWEKTIAAAKKEGQVTIYGNNVHEEVFRGFQKRYPEIKVVFVGGLGSQLGSRILSERRAGRYLTDLYVAGVDTPYTLFYRNKLLDPVPPALVLPEVLDESKWWGGRHHYADPDGQYVLIFEGSVQSGGISYNTKLVNPKEFQSFWDLLNPKWKGKIVALDPKVRGPVNQNLRFFFHHPKLGRDFIRRLFGEMEITISRDDRQMMDWVAAGRFAFNFFGRGISVAVQQGLPVREFHAGSFKEGALIDSIQGSVSLLSRPTHPNAARVGLNWLLSAEGQAAFQAETNKDGAVGSNSMREDISKESVHPARRRIKGVDYLFTGRSEWINMDPIYSLIDESVAKAKKN